MDNNNVDRHTKKASRNTDAECFHDDVSTVKKIKKPPPQFFTRLLEPFIGNGTGCCHFVPSNMHYTSQTRPEASLETVHTRFI